MRNAKEEKMTKKKKIKKKEKFEIKLHTKIDLAEEWLDELIDDLSCISELLKIKLEQERCSIRFDEDWMFDSFDKKICNLMNLRDNLQELSKEAEKIVGDYS